MTAAKVSHHRTADKRVALRFVAPTQGDTVLTANVAVNLAVSKYGKNNVRVRLNGKDVSAAFMQGRCRQDDCAITGTLKPEDGLRAGTNMLSASIGVKQGASLVERTRFMYRGLETPATGGAVTVDYYTPASVGINVPAPFGGGWIKLRTGNAGVPNDPIATLPALKDSNNTSTIAYPNTYLDVSCSTVYQAIILDRTNPTVQRATWCGSEVSDMATSVAATLKRSLGAEDLIVFGTAPGMKIDPAAPPDTSAFGGRDYSGFVGFDTPVAYLTIGVMGAAPGTAYESFSTALTSAFEPTVSGTLVLAENLYYNFVPDGEVDFQTASGTAAQVKVGNVTYAPPSGPTDAFWVLAFDRQTLQQVSVGTGTGTTHVECDLRTVQACGDLFDVKADGGAALAGALSQSPLLPSRLIFLTAVGCPFDNATQPVSALADALQAIGGVRHTLDALNPGAGTCAYSLVTVNDASHQTLDSRAALSTTQFSAQGQLGALHGYLARTNTGLYDIAGKDQVGTATDGSALTVDYTFEHVATQGRQDWPLTDRADTLMAYYDISHQLLTDPSLGWTGSHLYDVRYFYTDPVKANQIAALIDSRLGPTATNPVTPSTWDTTSAPWFANARTTLLNELQQVKNATGYLTGADNNGGVRGALGGGNNSIFANAFAVANDIGNDEDAALSSSVDATLSNVMNMAASIISLFGAMAGPAGPEVGVVTGVMSSSLRIGVAGMALDHGATTIPGPESHYDVTLSEIIDDASTYSGDLLHGFDVAVDSILSDSARLQTIGTLTADTDSHWSFKNLTDLDSLSDSIADGARRSLWLQVLPGLYGVRVATKKDSPDPRTYGSWKYDGAVKACLSLYSEANFGAINATGLFTSNPVGGPTNLWEAYLFAEGPTVVYPPNQDDYLERQMTQNLSTLLTTNQVVKWKDPNGRTRAETGLNFPKMALLTSGPFTYGPFAYYTDASGWYCDAHVSSDTQAAPATTAPAGTAVR